MKAVQYSSFGGPEVLTWADVDRPVPGPGQVLVRVVATSFNPVDDHIRAGHLARVIPTALPHVPGLDVAGVIDEVDAGVTGWEVGDRVLAMLPLDVAGGAAEHVAVDAEVLVAAPRTTALVDAATLPLVGLAARQAVVELARVHAGQTVLVNGAGGAVGSIAVQLALIAGAHVTATTSERHADRLRGYGVHRLVGRLDLTTDPVDVGGPFDVVLNHVRCSPQEATALAGFVVDGGVAVSSAGSVSRDRILSQDVWVRSDAASLAELVDHVDAGRLRLHVAARRPMAELAEVHVDARAGRLPGKTVLLAP